MLNLDSNKIKEMYTSGMSLEEISSYFNCSKESIRKRLVNLGIKRRKSKDFLTDKFRFKKGNYTVEQGFKVE